MLFFVTNPYLPNAISPLRNPTLSTTEQVSPSSEFLKFDHLFLHRCTRSIQWASHMTFCYVDRERLVGFPHLFYLSLNLNVNFLEPFWVKFGVVHFIHTHWVDTLCCLLLISQWLSNSHLPYPRFEHIMGNWKFRNDNWYFFWISMKPPILDNPEYFHHLISQTPKCSHYPSSKLSSR